MSAKQPDVLHYRRKPRPADDGDVTAARYEPGRSLDALSHVGRLADHRAELAEVRLPSETVLLVRWTRWHSDRPDLDWEVVRPGQYLAYSGGNSFLYSTDDDDLQQFYEPLPS